MQKRFAVLTRNAIFVAALLWSNSAAGQVCHAPAGAPTGSNDRGLEIPIKISGGGVIVPVVMNDGHSYSFLLDSGFEESVLDPTTAIALHLKAGAEHTEEAPGGEVKTSSVTGIQRRVEGIPLPGATLTALDLSGFAPFFGQHLDGILGYDFFQQFVVELDYPHQRLTLCEPSSFQTKRPAVPLHLETRQPYVDADLEGEKGAPIHARFEIDTGKVDPFSITAAFARKNGFLENPSALLAMRGVSVGGDTQVWVTRAKSVHFENVGMRDPVMAIAEDNVDRAGQLGYGLLRRYTVIFNYSRASIYFEAGPDADKPYEFDHAGLVLGLGGGDLKSLTAFMVIANTPAAQAGVQQGDEIVTINGQSAESMTLDQARGYFEHAIGSQKLTLRRNGASLAVVVVCKRLV